MYNSREKKPTMQEKISIYLYIHKKINRFSKFQ